MLDLLPPDVIGCIINEWIGNYHELTNLEIALSNYFHREKYLLALKSLCKITQLYEESPVFQNESKIMTFVAWKKCRNMCIDKLHLKVYSAASMDKLLINFFPNLLQLTIDQKEAEFDLSLLVFGSFPRLEILKLIKLENVFFANSKISSLLCCQPLELKELYLIENKFQPEEVVQFDSYFGYLVVFGQYCQKLQKLRYEPADNSPECGGFFEVVQMVQQIPSLQSLEYYYTWSSLPLWNGPLLSNTQFRANLEEVSLRYIANASSDSSFVRLLVSCCNSDVIKYLTLYISNLTSVDCELLVNWIESYGHNLRHIALKLFNDVNTEEYLEMNMNSNMILRKIAEICKSLEVFELRWFDGMDAETIVQLFRDGVCKQLRDVKFCFVEGILEMLQALCESNYPIDSITIRHCPGFKLSFLLTVIDTFHLRVLHLVLYYDIYEPGGQALSNKLMFIKFIRKLMKSPNMLNLEHLTVDFPPRKQTVVIDQLEEKEILDHWLFPFPELRTLTLSISLNVDSLVMHVLLSRIFKHCPKLQELEWKENNTVKKYNLGMIYCIKNQSVA